MKSIIVGLMLSRLLSPTPRKLLSNVALIFQIFLIPSSLSNCAHVCILKCDLIVENGCLHISLHSLSLNI